MIYTELLKLKSTKIPWLVLLGAIPANLVALFAFLPKIAPDGTPAGIDIQDMFYRQGMVLVMIAPSIFALFTAYIISREYQERTINQLFSYPVSRARILSAKLAVVFILIVMTTVLSCIAVLAASLVKLLQGSINFDIIWLGLKMNVWVCLLSFGTVPVAAAVTLIAKNVIPAAVLGVFATIVTVIGEIGHGQGGILFPWLTPYWPVRHLAQDIADLADPNPYAVPALIILSATFVLSMAFSLIYYVRSDVHSGS
ncbi:ABC transporter permease [Paenibacillus glycanilyticus]|uniref:ABC transporter permease n=1 Tax=Paenibacillus glycanilyticus TaxID=126569 RepID=UPI00203C5024|nr:ABC transporter permease [Paenibacillus glycanilyticus]MCM3627774.1 ABC transporter permease [Paenibacillus glycanilyticus]